MSGAARGATRQRLLRSGLAALLGGAAVAHVARPEWFLPMIPSWVPGDHEVVHAAATLAEATSAVLLLRGSTARAGGLLAAATLVGVFPANVQAALDGGYDVLPGWAGSATAAWLRLPLQVPPVLAAIEVARGAGDDGDAGRSRRPR